MTYNIGGKKVRKKKKEKRKKKKEFYLPTNVLEAPNVTVEEPSTIPSKIELAPVVKAPPTTKKTVLAVKPPVRMISELAAKENAPPIWKISTSPQAPLKVVVVVKVTAPVQA